VPHPEGGFYREVYRSSLTLPAGSTPHDAPRSAGTSIYHLLPTGCRSKWHRVIGSDELWIHQHGDDLDLQIAEDPENASEPRRLGVDGDMQLLVPADHWQAAEVREGPHGYALVCCIVVPGFDFADFEMRD
jgi:predicted cupin superfamily sugar epimerase